MAQRGHLCNHLGDLMARRALLICAKDIGTPGDMETHEAHDDAVYDDVPPAVMNIPEGVERDDAEVHTGTGEAGDGEIQQDIEGSDPAVHTGTGEAGDGEIQQDIEGGDYSASSVTDSSHTPERFDELKPASDHDEPEHDAENHTSLVHDGDDAEVPTGGVGVRHEETLTEDEDIPEDIVPSDEETSSGTDSSQSSESDRDPSVHTDGSEYPYDFHAGTYPEVERLLLRMENNLDQLKHTAYRIK
eukprot:8296-Hanusia_phi.AAC.1